MAKLRKPALGRASAGQTFPTGGLPLPLGAIAGAQGGYSDDSAARIALSSSGRYVAFVSDADGSRVAAAAPAKPHLSKVSLKNRRFAVTTKRTPKVAAKRKRRVAKGTAFRFTLNVRANVTIRVHRQLLGRKVGKACRRPSPTARAPRASRGSPSRARRSRSSGPSRSSAAERPPRPSYLVRLPNLSRRRW